MTLEKIQDAAQHLEVKETQSEPPLQRHPRPYGEIRHRRIWRNRYRRNPYRSDGRNEGEQDRHAPWPYHVQERLTHMEGVLADISPEINMVQIAVARLKGNLLEEGNWKKQMKGTGKKLYRSMLRAVDIPCAGSRFPAGLYEGPDQDQSGPSRLR